MSYLSEVINSNLINLELKGKNKEEVIEELTDLLVKEQKIESKNEFILRLDKRESINTTYCGSEIAIPHAISDTVKTPAVCFGRSSGIFWNHKTDWVQFIFMFAIPKNNHDENHISIMSDIARCSLNQEIRREWSKATTKDQILETLRNECEGNKD